MRQFFLSAAIWAATAFGASAQENTLAATGYPLTLEEAVAILRQNNNAIKISATAIEIAHAQKQQLQATWYPAISATGGYFHFSNDITADANMGELAQGLLQDLSGTIPGLEQLLSQLLPQLQQIIAGLGNATLSVPLLKQDMTSLDAAAVWPIITGGKRICAGRIGNSLQEAAEHLHTLTTNSQTALMLNAYYSLRLARQVEITRHEELLYMNRLRHNALRLMEEGFLNKAELLVVEVAADEATREHETARNNTLIAQDALNAILGKKLSQAIPQGNFFTLDSLPDINTLNLRILQHNPQLKILKTQEQIAESKRKIAQGNYIPNFALFARQNIYSNNIPKNLLPRTTIGVAMQWNIFDGLAREREITKSRLEQQQLEYTALQAEDDLLTAALALRGNMADASCNITTLVQTQSLAEELLRERERSFTEGMCTSTDVVAARTALTKVRTALELAGWQYCTSLAALLALSADTEEFIRLHNTSENRIAGN